MKQWIETTRFDVAWRAESTRSNGGRSASRGGVRLYPERIDAFCRTSRGMCDEDDIWRLAIRLIGFVAADEVDDPKQAFYDYCGSFSKIERATLLRPV